MPLWRWRIPSEISIVRHARRLVRAAIRVGGGHTSTHIDGDAAEADDQRASEARNEHRRHAGRLTARAQLSQLSLAPARRADDRRDPGCQRLGCDLDRDRVDRAVDDHVDRGAHEPAQVAAANVMAVYAVCVDTLTRRLLELTQARLLAGSAARLTEARRAEATVRVRSRALDRLLDRAAEVLNGIARLREAARKLPEAAAPAFEAEIDRLRRTARDLHGRVMNAWLTPFSALTERLPRTVRDIAHRLGKEVDLDVQGAEVELDRTVIEALGDPLTHLVRNAIDHGLETSPERLVAGKGPRGKLTLHARRALLALSIPGVEDWLGSRLRWCALAAGTPVEAGDALVTPFPVDHTLECVGLRLAQNGSSIVFSADTRPSPSLIDGAGDAPVEQKVPVMQVGVDQPENARPLSQFPQRMSLIHI